MIKYSYENGMIITELKRLNNDRYLIDDSGNLCDTVLKALNIDVTWKSWWQQTLVNRCLKTDEFSALGFIQAQICMRAFD